MSRGPGIIAASFGTTHADTTEQTIGAVENAVKERFPDVPVERAYTSRIIRGILAKRGTVVPDIAGAFEILKEQGVTDAVVLATQVIGGEEYDKVVKAAEEARAAGYFESINVTGPLIGTDDDMRVVLEAITEEAASTFAGEDKDREAIVLVGHGSEHPANAVYTAIDRYAKENGFPDIFVGTLEADPDIASVQQALKEEGYTGVLLTPMLLVAGDHAKNDIAGVWTESFEKEGFKVRTMIKGLGEYEKVRRLYLEHLLDFSWQI